MVDRDVNSVIKVAIFEQNEETLRDVLQRLDQTPNLAIQVLNDAAAFFEVYATSNSPDILLVGLDTNPEAALSAAKRIMTLSPTCGLMVYARVATMELLSRAMAIGARRYLPYPFDTALLRTAIDEVYEQVKPLLEKNINVVAPARERAVNPKVIAVFSPKGGVGTSTLAVNIACALSTMKRRVVIVDGNISFGNIGVFLNISPSKSMLELIGDPQGINDTNVEEVLLSHPSGVKVLLAPIKPEEADTVSGDHLRAIINVLHARFDYVVVDTWPSYDERVLAMLDLSDQILVPLGPELPSVKNLSTFLRVADLLHYPPDKAVPVLMRANSVSASYLQDIETFLKRPLMWRVMSDGKRVTQSVNNGEPFVLTEPLAPVSQNVFALARMIDGHPQEPTINASMTAESGQPFWRRLRLKNAG